MSGKFLASFSNSGRYYAHISNDGKLRIWDVISCTLKQEYTPDVHLTSPFTDLEWISSSKKISGSSSKRKRKLSDDNDNNDTNEYLALGSKSGSIFIYSVSSCSIANTFEKGHTSRVNSISWSESLASQLFSVYDDQQLIQWNLENGTISREWKCGKMSCVSVSPDGKSLVTAKTEIKWWNISEGKEELLKTFNGHATDVLSLKFVQISGETCVLSAAADNRFISAWLLNTKSKNRCALATFALDDALVSISVWNTNDGSLDVVASSRTGVLQAYHCRNGKKYSKPIKSKLNVQIGSESDNSKSPVQHIPIVGANICDENVAFIAYGNDTILSFEKLALNSSEENMFIVRQDPKKKILSTKQQSANKILPTTTSQLVQYAHPEAVNGFSSSNSSSKKPQKRSHSSSKTVDVPLQLRLENLALDVPLTSTAPASESLVHLLLQGLKSKDSRILHDVLFDKDENVIRNTINKLPVEAILPLSNELVTMMQGKRTESDAAVKWLKFVLIIHAAHLISNPEVTEIFAPVFPIIESRLNMLGPLHKLAGRLELMVEQIKHRTDQAEKSQQNIDLQPKLIYQDEDSEEDDDSNGDPFKDDVDSNDSDDHWPEDDDMTETDDESGQEQNADIDMENIDNT